MSALVNSSQEERGTYSLNIICAREPESMKKIQEIMKNYRKFESEKDYTFSWTMSNVTWKEVLNIKKEIVTKSGENLFALEISTF